MAPPSTLKESTGPPQGKRRPIATHLVVLTLAAAAPFVALVAYLTTEMVQNENRHATEVVQRHAATIAEDADQQIVRVRRILGALAMRPDVAALDPARCDPLLGELLQLNPQFANVFTVDASGRGICSALPLPQDRLSGMGAGRELDVLGGKHFTIGAARRDPASGKWSVAAAVPILAEDGEPVGAVEISIDFAALAHAVSLRSMLSPDAIVYMYDAAGMILVRSPDPEGWTGTLGTGSPIARIALERKRGTVRGVGRLGIDRVWAFEPVHSTGWIVLAGLRTEIALESVRRMAATIALLCVLSLAFAILLGMGIARSITRPVTRIAESARRMSAGDSAGTVAPRGPAEIASLMSDLNQLLERRVAAEHELGQSEAMQKETERVGLTGTWRFLQDESLSMSEQAMELFGLPRDVRPTYGALLAAIHPENRASSAERFREALASDALYFDDEFQVVLADGQARSLQSIGRIRRDAAGRFIEASGTVHDVTERKQATELLREGRQRLLAIVNSAMDAIITVDADQRITLFNPAAERMFGIDSTSMIGRALEELIPESLRERHSGDVRNFGETGGTSRTMGALGTVHGRRANGETFPIEVAISQATVAGRKLYTAIVRDITDRERAQQDLQRLNTELEARVRARTADLEAANRELHAFDYSISHDLRAPLNRIRGFGEALVEGFGDRLGPEGLDLMKRVHAAGDSMDRLITDMLALSTISRGDILRCDVDMSALARHTLESLERADPGRKVEFAIAPGCRAEADPGLMHIALENLLGNAWKFTSKRLDARIEFGCRNEGGEQRFFVRDNGAGFDPGRSGQLFEPFRRLHTQSEFPGTGIGLATVRRIVRRHGGRTWAESRVGEGATFWFTASPPETAVR